MPDPILVAKHGDIECHLLPGLANRHGLITGATGTGKTTTLQTMAENFRKIGVPVFMADVKGDLTGISQKGVLPPKVGAILKERGLPEPAPFVCPTTLWDVFGEQGHPVPATRHRHPEYDQTNGQQSTTQRTQPQGATKTSQSPTTGVRPRSAQEQAPTQPQSQPNTTVPGAGAVNQELKSRKPAMTDKERAAKGLLIGKYINILLKEINDKKIPSEQWKAWLKTVYKYGSIYEIRLEAYQGILKTLREQPSIIINFKEPPERQPGEDDEPLPEETFTILTFLRSPNEPGIFTWKCR